MKFQWEFGGEGVEGASGLKLDSIEQCCKTTTVCSAVNGYHFNANANLSQSQSQSQSQSEFNSLHRQKMLQICTHEMSERQACHCLLP